LNFYYFLKRSNETFQNQMNNISISQNITQKNKTDFPNFSIFFHFSSYFIIFYHILSYFITFYHILSYFSKKIFLIDEDIEEDDIEGNKALTLEEFRSRALDKLETNNKKNQSGIKMKHKSQSKSKKK